MRAARASRSSGLIRLQRRRTRDLHARACRSSDRPGLWRGRHKMRTHAMTLRRGTFAFACLAGAIALAGSAHARYLLSPPGNGGQLQIGTGLPLPIGTAGIFIGGMTPVNGGTMAPPPAPPVDGPGVTYWPPLLVRTNPAQMG